jgi:hypothetical protein
MINGRLFSITIIVAIGYIVFNQIQLLIYSGNFFTDEFNTFAYSIFIPHGWRILAFLIYGYKSIPGMLVGHLYAGYYVGDNFQNLSLTFFTAIIIASFCVPAASYILKEKFKDLLNNFDTKYILFLTIISALINSLSVNFLRFFADYDFSAKRFTAELFGYLVGDIFGVVLIIFIYLIIKRLFYLSIEVDKK